MLKLTKIMALFTLKIKIIANSGFLEVSILEHILKIQTFNYVCVYSKKILFINHYWFLILSKHILKL